MMTANTTSMAQVTGIISGLLSRGCARFLANIARYTRDGNGEYRWAYTGTRIIVRVSEQEHTQLTQALAAVGNYGRHRSFPLTINGKMLGEVFISRPQAHGGCFLYLDLAEPFIYDGRVVRRFAQLGGFNVSGFDMKLLEIVRESDNEKDQYFF